MDAVQQSATEFPDAAEGWTTTGSRPPPAPAERWRTLSPRALRSSAIRRCEHLCSSGRSVPRRSRRGTGGRAKRPERNIGGMSGLGNAIRHIAFSCVLLALAPAVGTCDGYFRCGQSLVSAEMSVVELLQKCGSPSSEQVSYVDVRNEYGVKVGTSTVETWRYDRGSRQFAMIVIVVDGKIENIASEVHAHKSKSPQ